VELYEESLKVNWEVGNKISIADTMLNVGNVLLLQGDFSEAEKIIEESIGIVNDINAKGYIIASINFSLGRLAFIKKEYEKAGKYFYENLISNMNAGSIREIAIIIIRITELNIETENFKPAATLLGFVKNYSEFNKIYFPDSEQKVFDESVLKLKEKYNEEEFLKYFEEGKLMTLEQAVEIAIFL